MTAMRQDRNLTQVVIGFGVLALGVIFTLDNVGVIDAGDYLKYWPLVLVGIGLAQIAQSSTWPSYGGAVIWVLVGLWLLGRNVGLVRVGIWDIWPLVIAAIGALLVFRGWHGYDIRRNRLNGSGGTASPAEGTDVPDDGWMTAAPSFPSPPVPPPALPASSFPTGQARDAEHRVVPPPIPRDEPSGDRPASAMRDISTVNAFVIMGGIGRRLTTQDFKGGSVAAIMGGAKIDLRQASIAQGEAVIDVLAFWGGVEIKIPDDWLVVPQIFPFMGGFEDRTGPPPAASRKRLIVRGLAFMGGVEVKH